MGPHEKRIMFLKLPIRKRRSVGSYLLSLAWLDQNKEAMGKQAEITDDYEESCRYEQPYQIRRRTHG